MCRQFPRISHDHVLQYVQVTYEEQNFVGQEAVQELLNLRKQMIENPKMELDKQTKRLRQAFFKQQYKLRQERSCTELTEIEQEALMVCGVVEVLGEIDVENAVDMANKPAATAPTWNQASMAGMCVLPLNDIGYNVEGLFVA
jgi:hypothetical protein